MGLCRHRMRTTAAKKTEDEDGESERQQREVGTKEKRRGTERQRNIS